MMNQDDDPFAGTNGKYVPLIDDKNPSNNNASPKGKITGFGNSDFSPAAGIGGTAAPSGATAINMPTGTVPSAAPVHSTLDEPVSETLKRDLLSIWRKIKLVLAPTGNDGSALRDWDLWGPLLLCLALAITLGFKDSSTTSYTFTLVFVIIWCGSAVVTVNATLLGGRVSFFQSVCVLGYCIFPLNVASLIALFVPSIIIRGIIGSITYIWAFTAAVNFLGKNNLERRRVLAVYPIFLFYFILSWLILIS